MAENQIAVELREGIGKGVARKLRAAGLIPGVFYGQGTSQAISLEPRPLERLLASSSAGLNTLINLTGGGALDGKQVLVKDLQRDPVRGTLLHADLYAIDVKQVVHVSVPIHLTGIPEGVTLDAGILDQVIREIELECLPTAIPEELPVDVTSLGLGDSLHVRDIALPAGVTLLTDADLSVASVAQPKAAEEEVAPVEGEEEGAEAAAAAEDGDAKAEAPAEGGGDAGDDD
jgi:large subunit ribosomal protein L25